jgi:hypothetical protein
VLRTILLYLDGTMTRFCTASERTIAERASLSPKQVAVVKKAAAKEGLVQLHDYFGQAVVEVTIDYDDADLRTLLHELWRGPRDLRRRYARSLGSHRTPLSSSDELLLRVREPYYDAHAWTEEQIESGEAWDYEEDDDGNRVYRNELHHTPRFYWIRDVVDAPEFARVRGQRRSRMYAIKAVAFAIDLLTDKNGLPYRWTTISELGRLAGLKDAKTVRWAIAQLEQRLWINVQRRPIRGVGGLLINLTVPLRQPTGRIGKNPLGG